MLRKSRYKLYIAVNLPVMKQFLAVALFTVLFVSCKKKDDNLGANSLDFTSIRQFDVHAVQIGTEGNTSDEYTMEDWPQWVYDLFSPLDTADLKGYTWSEITVDRVYPNPCADTQTMRYFATQPVNMKIVIIDPNKNVYWRKSYALYSTIHNISFDYRNTGMTAGNYYRMFYAFSAENKPYFIRGHIDIYKEN